MTCADCKRNHILPMNRAKWHKATRLPCAECSTLRAKLDAAEAEIARLTNAAKSRVKCPQGHSPQDSRGACWFCDAEKNAATLATISLMCSGFDAEAKLPQPSDQDSALAGERSYVARSVLAVLNGGDNAL